jgi:CDP-diacylglycerol--serine O-phosphatidyltransferase
VLKHIPNAITSANLFFGCLSIVATFDGNPTLAATYIVIAAILDFFDGFAARLLKVSGEFSSDFLQFVPLLVLISYLPFSLMIFSAIRLAKFNIDTRQTDSFIGLPTPANALFICAIPFVMADGPIWAENIFNSIAFLSLYPIVFSYLLIAELPLFALKFKHFGVKGNEVRYLFLTLCLLLISLFTYVGIALCILLYLTLSLFLKIKNKSA